MQAVAHLPWRVAGVLGARWARASASDCSGEEGRLQLLSIDAYGLDKTCANEGRSCLMRRRAGGHEQLCTTVHVQGAALRSSDVNTARSDECMLPGCGYVTLPVF